ncbi:MAG: hypothetical protein V3T96_04375, partial [Thermodesulfobacteriota bacterium]
MEDSWREKLQVGDKVIVSGGNSWIPDTVETIERFTKKQIVIVGLGTKFRRDSGRAVGGCAWSTQWLREAKEEKIAALDHAQKRRVAMNYLNKIEWKDFTLESLQEIIKTIKD